MFEPRCRPSILCGTRAWAGCELDHPRVTGFFAATRSIPLGSARVWLVLSHPLLRRGYRARPPRPFLAPGDGVHELVVELSDDALGLTRPRWAFVRPLHALGRASEIDGRHNHHGAMTRSDSETFGVNLT